MARRPKRRPRYEPPRREEDLPLRGLIIYSLMIGAVLGLLAFWAKQHPREISEWWTEVLRIFG